MAIKRTVNLKINDVISDIEDRANRFVVAAVGEAAKHAMRLTPREYGTLASDQFTSVVRYGDHFIGTVGYTSLYAKYLNGLPGYKVPSWSPRAVSEKEGPSANMRAVPGFLTLAFESPDAQAEINKLLDIFNI